MNITIVLILFLLIIVPLYYFIGTKKIKDCYLMWFSKKYWTDYNIVEAASWFTKAVIIVPNLIFGIQIWWLYFLSLFTSVSLIWASNKKLLPTLVGFNTLWVFISCAVLIKHFI